MCGPDESACAGSLANPRLDRAREADCSLAAVGSRAWHAAGVHDGQGMIAVFADDICDTRAQSRGQPSYESLSGTLAEVSNNDKRPKSRRNLEPPFPHKPSEASCCAVENSDTYTASPPSNKRFRAAVLDLSRPTNKKQEAHQLKVALAASLRTAAGESGH